MKTFKWTFPEFPVTERERNPPSRSRKSDTARTGKSNDRAVLRGIGIYSLIHVAWLFWIVTGSGFRVFDSIVFIGLVTPGLGLLILIGYQCANRHNRFSVRGNLLALLTVGVWFLAVASILASASAAV